jgi:hypothetical protein
MRWASTRETNFYQYRVGDMFGTEIIEVGIGLAFAYFAISIICSGIVEAGVKITKLRAKHMKAALGELLDDKHFNGFVKELYDHYLITSPLKDRLGDPTSIKSRNFAMAVLDILGKSDKLTEKQQIDAIRLRITSIKDEAIRKRLLSMLESSAYQVDTLRDKIEAWFNESMESVSEWYRERMRKWVAIVSIVVVGVMNADTIKMATMFWNDDELRTATVTAADAYVKRYDERVKEGTAPALVHTTTTVMGSDGKDSLVIVAPAAVAEDTNVVRSIKSTLDTLYTDINAMKVLPIGWSGEVMPGQPGYADTKSPFLWWLLKIVGLTLTIGAVSLGSTYWYRQLKSLLSLRIGKGDPAPAPEPTPNPPTPSPQAPSRQGADETPPTEPETPADGGDGAEGKDGGGS